VWYKIVGTSHVASESLREVRAAFKEWAPVVVAVELDIQRMQALASGAKPSLSPGLIRVVGIRGYLFAVIGGFLQRRIGRIVGITPGSEMLTTVRLAHKNRLPVLLIDRDIRTTLQRVSKAFGWREIWQLIKDLFRGLIKREKVKIRLDKVPDTGTISMLLKEFRKRFPRLYKALVTERNHYMARALKHHHLTHPESKVLVVVGAGHVEGLKPLLEKV